MSALQWVLLILSVAIVVAVVVISRRRREPTPRRESRREEVPAAAPSPVREQLEIFPVASPVLDAPAFPQPVEPDDDLPEAPVSIRAPNAAVNGRTEPVAGAGLGINPLTGQQYDEFGVGRVRRRSAPGLDTDPGIGPATVPAEPEAAPITPVPAWVRAAPKLPPTVAPPTVTPTPVTPPASPKVEQKIVSLLIVERSGGSIAGSKLHSALSAQGLAFGAKQIYHRLARNETVFAVASLTKPGVLVPADAQQFSTPGLSTFMVLPGPVKPLTALHDLLATTQALARALNAEVYDSKKQPLTSETMRTLQADVEAWARAAHL